MSFKYSPQIVTDGLVFAVDAANPKSYVSGDTTCNSLVSSNVGTITNTGPVDRFWDPSKGGSWVFDGTDDYIDCGHITEIQNAPKVTLSFWANVGSVSFNIFYGQHLTWPAPEMFQFYYWGTNVLYVHITSGGVGYESYVNTSAIINIGEWNHFTTVFDGTQPLNDDRCKLYINGGSDIITTHGAMPTTFVNSTDSFLIGKGTNGYFTGALSDTLIYNKALSPAESLQNYNALKSRFI